jgi:3-methyladenine DNA glycosylase AlkD
MSAAKAGPPRTTKDDVLRWLEKTGTKAEIEAQKRYGIAARRPYGVRVGVMMAYAKKVGRDHDLAAQLWAAGRYEARMLACMIDDPALVTPKQMDAWARDFDNWGICDTVCFKLFDYTDHAFARAKKWSQSPREFVKRAGFALMAGQVARNRALSDEKFLEFFPLIEKGAEDERNFVMKGVNWALRRIGGRSPKLHKAALALAAKLAASKSPSARWVGKDALRDLSRPLILKSIARSS